MAATFTMTQTPDTNPARRCFTVVWIGPDQGIIYDVALRIARNWEDFSEKAHFVRGMSSLPSPLVAKQILAGNPAGRRHQAVSYTVGRTNFDLFIVEIDGLWHFEGCSGNIVKESVAEPQGGEFWELNGEGDPVELTMFGAYDADFRPESLGNGGSNVAGRPTA